MTHQEGLAAGSPWCAENEVTEDGFPALASCHVHSRDSNNIQGTSLSRQPREEIGPFDVIRRPCGPMRLECSSTQPVRNAQRELRLIVREAGYYYSYGPRCAKATYGERVVEYCYENEKVNAADALKRCTQKHSSAIVHTFRTNEKISYLLFSLLGFSREYWVNLKAEDIRRERQRTKSPAPTGTEHLRSRSRLPSRRRTGQTVPWSSSKSGRSRSRRRSRSEDPSAVLLQTPPARDTRWADSVKGTSFIVTREVPPLSEHGAAKIAQLERENALLRSAFERLQAEVAEPKSATVSSPSQSPPQSGTADVLIEMLSEAPADE
ncbi:hypothetical protein HPB51_024641 [Rhipicephalus microplus]|uniref:Uncharacterized protein n=1 Tax=Rhipicephalus microplus TaxID=6941 RepID=A0A9J6EPH7_RHIMP|nr:hypothetical protein HPB51_024641 [Rhipicephalus microplus]